MDKDDDFFGSLGDIFKGGLQTALDLETEKQRAEISNKSISAETQIYLQGDDRLVRTGQQSMLPSVGSVPVVWIAAGVAALMFVYLIARRV